MLRIAHRGASQYEAENSMAAFRKAVELGADFIEADVLFTKDSVPVIRHDKLLDRTTNLSGYVHDFTYSELLEKGLLSNGEKIPALKDLCSFVAVNDVKLYIDLKTFGKEQQVLDTLLATLPEDKFLLGAFHSGVIRHVKELNPNVSTVLIIEGNPLQLEEEIAACGCDIVAFGFDSIDEEMVKRVQRIPKKVFTWTVDDPREIERARRMGVDGITSNCPDLI